ncbi:MAG: phosphoadenylyl-sulfate reductase [Planctomycetota bacterium]|nr:phosphoadenylyl-sulfate reductase [Planctomycetota bacterium]
MPRDPNEFFDHEAKSRELEDASPPEIVRWAVDFFGKELCMSTSFQLGGMTLLHMLAEAQQGVPEAEKIPVLFVDTGFHFPETLAFKDEVVRRYGINLVALKPIIDRETFKRFYGDDRLYERNPNECCRINKVEPMQRALKGYGAQLIALRRDAGGDRAGIGIVEKRTDGKYLIHPLANWTREQANAYLKQHDIPSHPLHAKGYKTIGCFPPMCTVPVSEHAPERAGRWTGTGKAECGLHQVAKARPAADFSI